MMEKVWEATCDVSERQRDTRTGAEIDNLRASADAM